MHAAGLHQIPGEAGDEAMRGGQHLVGRDQRADESGHEGLGRLKPGGHECTADEPRGPRHEPCTIRKKESEVLQVHELLLRVAVALTALAVWLLPQRFWRWLLTRRHLVMRRLRPWLHHRSGSGGWWWSAGNWLLKLMVVSALLHQLAPAELALEAAGALRGALGGELAALIPVQGPAGLGTYEAAVWALSGVPVAHVGTLAGVALLVHSFCLSVSLCFALVWGVLGRWPAQAVAQS